MDIETLTDLAESFPQCTTDLKWGNHLTFNVAEKMFFMIILEQVPLKANFKSSFQEMLFHQYHF